MAAGVTKVQSSLMFLLFIARRNAGKSHGRFPLGVSERCCKHAIRYELDTDLLRFGLSYEHKVR
jgi:hypothetical protein